MDMIEEFELADADLDVFLRADSYLDFQEFLEGLDDDAEVGMPDEGARCPLQHWFAFLGYSDARVGTIYLYCAGLRSIPAWMKIFQGQAIVAQRASGRNEDYLMTAREARIVLEWTKHTVSTLDSHSFSHMPADFAYKSF